ncbi:hypothetical protein PTTG_29743, partial [Puccinia triticina 1-1 BBBD Race 1]
AFQGRLSDSKKACMMQEGLCFRCGVQGQISRECPTKKGNNRGSARITVMEDQMSTCGQNGSVRWSTASIFGWDEVIQV